MTKDIEIEIFLLETSWKLYGLINENKSEKIMRDFFYSGNPKSIDTRELLWGNKNGTVITNNDYLKLEGAKKLFCEFYEWIGISCEGKLQGYVQQWYRNGNKRFEGNYVDGKRHGDFIIYKESGEEEFYGAFENGDLLETNYGF
jgi:antitoxin component YwqK of YwqJK toxin-antitoxin module